jgi:hypothetical protein
MNKIDYNNLTDDQKDVYAQFIRDYLRFGPDITPDRVTPEAAQIVDKFIKALHDCTRRIKVFTNLFKSASTLGDFVKAVGKEAAKKELKDNYSKSISLTCYTAGLSNYQQQITPYLF